MQPDPSIDLSIIIVNYNVKLFVEKCLRSIQDTKGDLNVEIFVVDNASEDGSVEYLRERFTDVVYIANQQNKGFGTANNQALCVANGKFLLVLNPDTIVHANALQELCSILSNRPDVGAVGPKLVNEHGAFDRSSKRGLPTPWASLCRLIGLSKLFPKSKLFGSYDLLYLDPEQSHEVDILQGACILVRRKVYETVGGFDETFFMYGEDVDWSYRIQQAGWKVLYYPKAVITHYRGESSKHRSFDRDKAFYEAMRIFALKHYSGKYSPLTLELIDIGVSIALLVARIRSRYKNLVG